MRLAITRDISPGIVRCELTHMGRQPIDIERARAQHGEYEQCLRTLGCAIQHLPAALDMSDSVFVEDCAIVLDEMAVVTRPGAESRRPETTAVEEALRAFRPLGHIEPPGTLDGGDVLRVGRTLLVGVSSRSNAAAIAQLGHLAGAFGYSVVTVEVRGCLHLKSAVTEVATGTLLVNRSWIREDPIRGFDYIEIDPGEPFAANALRIGDDVVYGAAFPRTRERLEACGLRVHVLDVSELAKAEGALTCCSLLVDL